MRTASVGGAAEALHPQPSLSPLSWHLLHLPSIRCIPQVSSLQRIPSFVPSANTELCRPSVLALEMQPGARAGKAPALWGGSLEGERIKKDVNSETNMVISSAKERDDKEGSGEASSEPSL